MSKIHPSDNQFKTYDFQISEFCEICGIDHRNGKNYSDLKATIKKLSDKSMWIELQDGAETFLRWSEKPYIYRLKGTIKIKIDEDMRPFLLELRSHFTKYNLIYILTIKSQYSIRLYELLKIYENIVIITISLVELKTRLFAEIYTR